MATLNEPAASSVIVTLTGVMGESSSTAIVLERGVSQISPRESPVARFTEMLSSEPIPLPSDNENEISKKET